MLTSFISIRHGKLVIAKTVPVRVGLRPDSFLVCRRSFFAAASAMRHMLLAVVRVCLFPKLVVVSRISPKVKLLTGAAITS